LREDRIWPDGRSRNSIQEECKEKAIQMMQRNAAYSNLVAEAFPRYIRLSIHPNSNSDEWGTPWHNVLMLKKDGSCQLMKRKEAEERKYKLLHENGRPSYFVE
jgi:pyoverdine/dityrosine biosynthesis protein Dit1